MVGTVQKAIPEACYGVQVQVQTSIFDSQVLHHCSPKMKDVSVVPTDVLSITTREPARRMLNGVWS